MAEDDAAGPYLMIPTGDGPDVPLYLVSFDKQGRCTAPRTRLALLADAASGRFTDLHIYSHGWNNVFDEAVQHYTEFFREYFRLRPGAGLDAPPYHPLLVGLIWPSTALLAPGEETPALAGTGVQAPFPEVAALAAELPAQEARRLVALASQPGPLGGDDALMLASLLAPLLDSHAGGDDDSGLAPGSAAALLQRWGRDSATEGARSGAPGSLPIAGEAAPAGLEAGGVLGFLNPIEIIRKATVYIMKDRAGLVGSTGAAALLRDALASHAIRVHLTGHSYGAKLVLSALAELPSPQRVTSVLLLQPAISARCFARRIEAGGDRPGGYRAVLDKMVLPLFTTFSPHDRALGSFYPLALRRGRDLGEVAGIPGPFAALGAVGPQGMAQDEVLTTQILGPPAVYPQAAPGVRVCALDGSAGIMGHGDVRNDFTEWALANLVRQGAAS